MVNYCRLAEHAWNTHLFFKQSLEEGKRVVTHGKELSLNNSPPPREFAEGFRVGVMLVLFTEVAFLVK